VHGTDRLNKTLLPKLHLIFLVLLMRLCCLLRALRPRAPPRPACSRSRAALAYSVHRCRLDTRVAQDAKAVTGCAYHNFGRHLE
jgi:hypothetical protein